MPINHNLIIVTPVYEDIISFKKLLEELNQHLKESFYLVVIDDGSIHSPLNSSILDDYNIQGKVIHLKTNVGHQKAIAIGLSFLHSHLNNQNAHIIIMDSDGEDKPETINILIEKKLQNRKNIIVAQRTKREETFIFKLFYLVYKFIFKLLTGKKINFGNFMLLDSKALDRICMMNEVSLHLAACVLSSKLPITYESSCRGKRYDGKSKMNFNSLVLHGFKALMVFIESILVRIGLFCAFTLFCCMIAGITAITLKLIGFVTPGWFSISIGVMLIIFLQTGTLTLMTLMLTGLLKVTNKSTFNYKEWIKN